MDTAMGMAISAITMGIAMSIIATLMNITITLKVIHRTAIYQKSGK